MLRHRRLIVWALATTVGFTIGDVVFAVLALYVAAALFLLVGPHIDFYLATWLSGVIGGLLGGAIGGAVFGLVQFRTGRRLLPLAASRFWVPASAIAFAVTGALSLAPIDAFLPGGDLPVLQPVIRNALDGLILGACQGATFFARKKAALSWLLALVVAIILSGIASQWLHATVAMRPGPVSFIAEQVASFFFSGVITGAATSVVLARWPRVGGTSLELDQEPV